MDQEILSRTGIRFPEIGRRTGCESRPFAAYTLIEVIGVLAIIAILATVMAPNIFRRMTDAKRAAEQTDLRSIAEAFTNEILLSYEIPAHTNWAEFIADNMELPAAEISSVVGNSRAFYIDSASSISLPYFQTNSLPSSVNSARVMIVSSLGPALPYASGVLTAAQFENIWTNSYPDVPAGWPGTWSGHGDDLTVERIELKNLFCRVILNNMDLGTNGPRYAINASSVITVPTNNLVDGYVLAGSVLSLYDNSGTEDTREMIAKDTSFFYERGIWRNQFIDGKQKTTSATYSSNVVNVLELPLHTGASDGNIQAAIDIYNLFMTAYSQWAADTNSNPAERERTVTGLQLRLKQVTSDAIQ